MPDHWPTAALFAFLFCVALLRAGGTYLLARGARYAARRAGFLERSLVARAETAVRRWGAPVVSLSFLTIGVQTAVQAAAGSLRMPLRRYLPALAVGALLWATLYLTIGLAVLEAFWGGLSLPIVAAAAGAVLVLAGVTVYVRRGRGLGSGPGSAGT